MLDKYKDIKNCDNVILFSTKLWFGISFILKSDEFEACVILFESIVLFVESNDWFMSPSFDSWTVLDNPSTTGRSATFAVSPKPLFSIAFCLKGS